MRILLVADLHYSLHQFDWVLECAGDFDMVVMAGDHLDLAALLEPSAQTIVVRKYFEKLAGKTRLVTCSGNHDLDVSNDAGEKVAGWLTRPPMHNIPSDGESFIVGDTLFTVCPWWDGPATRERLAAQLEAAAARREGFWIWIHHAPPDNSPVSWGGARSFGDRELSAWIARYRPDIVLSGHVHQSPFVAEGSWVDRIGETWVFNTGQQFGAPPAHIIIDTEAREALWFSSAGNQFVRLGQALERPVPCLEAIPAWLRAADRPRVTDPA